MARAVFQRIEEFGCEAGKYLDRLFRSFCPVWRVVKNGSAVSQVEGGEQVPDLDRALQEDQNVHVPGSREFGDAMLNRSSV
jgi:hypothetical protein